MSSLRLALKLSMSEAAPSSAPIPKKKKISNVEEPPHHTEELFDMLPNFKKKRKPSIDETVPKKVKDEKKSQNGRESKMDDSSVASHLSDNENVHEDNESIEEFVEQAEPNVSNEPIRKEKKPDDGEGEVTADEDESNAPAQKKRKKGSNRNRLLEEALAFNGNIAQTLELHNLSSGGADRSGLEDSELKINVDLMQTPGYMTPRVHGSRVAAEVAKTKLTVTGRSASTPVIGLNESKRNDELAIGGRTPGRGRGRGRSGRGRGGRGNRSVSLNSGFPMEAGDEEEGEADGDATGWVQCDKCNKWRTLPKDISSESLPDNWECSMNTWDNKNSCDVPEETATTNDDTGERDDDEEANLRRRSSGRVRIEKSTSDWDLSNSNRPVAVAQPKRPYHRKLVPTPRKHDGFDDDGHYGAYSSAVIETTNWIQCTGCQKWRVVAPHIDSSEFPKEWFCHFNTWAPEFATCNAPEEDLTKKAGRESGGYIVVQENDGEGAITNTYASGTPVAAKVEKTVTGWVQCSRRNCKKWRKVPAHVDMSKFPEKWYCEMNTWDLDRASCDYQEESDSDAEAGDAVDEGGALTPAAKKNARLGTVNNQLITSNSKSLSTLSYRRIIFTSDGRLRPVFTEKNKNGYGVFSFSESRVYPSCKDAQSSSLVSSSVSRDNSDEYVEPSRTIGYWWSSAFALNGDRKDVFHSDAQSYGSENYLLLQTILSHAPASMFSGSSNESKNSCYNGLKFHKLHNKVDEWKKIVAGKLSFYDRVKYCAAVVRSVLTLYVGNMLNEFRVTEAVKQEVKTTDSSKSSDVEIDDDEGDVEPDNSVAKVNIYNAPNGSKLYREYDGFSFEWLRNQLADVTFNGRKYGVPTDCEAWVPNQCDLCEVCRLLLVQDVTLVVSTLRLLEKRCEVEITLNKITVPSENGDVEKIEVFMKPLCSFVSKFLYMLAGNTGEDEIFREAKEAVMLDSCGSADCLSGSRFSKKPATPTWNMYTKKNEHGRKPLNLRKYL